MLQFSHGHLPETHGTAAHSIIWLLKLGVAAAVSSTLVRSKEFKSLLFREERTFRQKVYLVLWMALADHGRRLDSLFRSELSGRRSEF